MAAGCRAAGRRCSPRCATTPWRRCCRTRTSSAAASAARRSSHRRRCWRRCCATTNAPATSCPPRRWSAPARRWPAAASTTSWPAGSPATASTPRGWCRTSRRCSTTTPYCFGCMRTGPVAHRSRWRAKSPRETARFMIDDLGVDGMFTSSLDADADGREGLTYVWTPAQLVEVLGDDDGRWAAELFGVTDGRHIRARQLGAATARRPRRSRAVRAGAHAHCSRPAHPAAARPRRQGRHRLERAGDHRARGGQCRARSPRIARRRNAMRRADRRSARR